MTLHLQIVTPEGMVFDGPALRATLPTATGPVTILPRHIPYVALLKSGHAKVVTEQGERTAACGSGFLAVTQTGLRVAAETFSWE